ncbi:hypothetical protein [Treponema sp. R80B11-R83G3]
MEVKLGKWEKGETKRIYFNAPALGNSKAFAFANKDGNFEIGQQVFTPGQDKTLSDAINAGVEAIEKIIGKPIIYNTKFIDVWSAIN